MELLKYLYRVIRVAFSQSVSLAQDAVFLAIIILGILITQFPKMTIHYDLTDWAANLSGWKIAFIILCVIIGIRLFLATFWIHKENMQEISRLKLVDGKNRTKVNTSAAAILIEFGEGPEFSKVRTFANGLAIRDLQVKVTNCGDGFLTNCMVKIKTTHPALPDRAINIMSAGSPLIPGQFKWVPMATYPEVRPSSVLVPNLITLGWSYGGGFLGGELPTFSPLTKESPFLLTMEASSPECQPCEATFEIWINDAGLLTSARH